jgi:alkylhydroperoxidase family enzyme
MTWFAGVPEGETDWDRLASVRPEAFDALAGLVGSAWKDSDPVLLELARLRMATLIANPAESVRPTRWATDAGLSETQVAALAAWPTSPLFTARERACLALTEQFVMDANGVTDAQVEAVTEHLGAAGCYAFVEAVSVLETFQRACLTLGIRSAPSHDEIVRRIGRNQTPTEVP